LITTNLNKRYIIKFNTPLSKGTFTEKLSSYPQLTVKDSGGVSRNVFYEEVPESYTGVDLVDVVNSGINYPDSTTVSITGDGTGATATVTVLNGKIRSVTVTNKGSGYTRAYVQFNGAGGSEAEAAARLEAKYGTLRTFYYKDNGEKVVVNSEAGTVNYETGEVVLAAVNPSAVITNNFFDTNILTINVVPDGEIIPPLRNRILTVEETNAQSIQIEMIAESS